MKFTVITIIIIHFCLNKVYFNHKTVYFSHKTVYFSNNTVYFSTKTINCNHKTFYFNHKTVYFYRKTVFLLLFLYGNERLLNGLNNINYTHNYSCKTIYFQMTFW